ncbi:hypothetical protein ACQEVZ_50565 [Dactylosporangium sp. CA-152071]|uniref:hypothetical protein n=1 Tax=Dactylosporangium sp. CA-152071 TaxID=3239933 RepID=UPI003D89E3E7
MQITMWVPYDERRLRRTIAVVMRPQVRRMRIMGGILLALGVLLIATGMMLGKVQSLTIPKDTMTDEQRVEFAAFLVAEQQRQAGRAFLGRPR